MRLAALLTVFASAAAEALEGPSIMEMKEAVAPAASARPSRGEKEGDPQAVKILLLELKAQVARTWAALSKENMLWEQAQLRARLGDYNTAYNMVQKIIRTRHAGGPRRQGGRRNIVENGEAHAFLAEILAAVGRQDAAVREVEEAWNRAQKPGVHINTQNNVRRSKQYIEEYPPTGKAYEEAKKIYGASPGDPDALYKLVAALKQLKWRDEELLTTLARLRSEFPDHPHMRNGWGDWDFGHTCNRLGLRRRAAESFEHMAKEHQDHPMVKRGNANWQGLPGRPRL